MVHLYQLHTKRQRKCRMSTEVPLTFRIPSPPLWQFEILHKLPAGETASSGHEVFPASMIASHEAGAIRVIEG